MMQLAHGRTRRGEGRRVHARRALYLIARQLATSPMRVFARWIEYSLNILVDRLEDAHFREHHPTAIFAGVHQHLNCSVPLRSVLLGFRKLPDVVRDVAKVRAGGPLGSGTGWSNGRSHDPTQLPRWNRRFKCAGPKTFQPVRRQELIRSTIIKAPSGNGRRSAFASSQRSAHPAPIQRPLAHAGRLRDHTEFSSTREGDRGCGAVSLQRTV